jgi:hypothetical protein
MNSVIHGEAAMSTINQINNLPNLSAAQVSGSRSDVSGGLSQSIDWFTDNISDSSQPIIATSYFDSNATIEQMSHTILSCIGDTTTL